MSAPLTPPACDVRALPYMPFEVGRLLDSDFYALSTGDQFKAGLALWCKSWTQVPAASMPSDELLLARAVGLTLDAWRDVADMALRGWVECDDGRLYHPVVAEKALRGWIERIQLKERSAKGNATRYETFTYTPEAFAAMKADAVRHLARLNPAAEAEFGVILQGEPMAPVRRPSGSRKESPKEPISSQLKVTEPNETERKGTEERALVVPAAPEPTVDVHAALDLYNETAGQLGLPKALALTPPRRAKLLATLKAHGMDGWSAALAMLASSPHCLGQNDRGWRASLDFLLAPASFLKLIEGQYQARPGSGGPRAPSGGGFSYTDLALEGAGA